LASNQDFVVSVTPLSDVDNAIMLLASTSIFLLTMVLLTVSKKFINFLFCHALDLAKRVTLCRNLANWLWNCIVWFFWKFPGTAEKSRFI